MKKAKQYVNGRFEEIGQMTNAREVLIRKGLYSTLGNFGPFFQNKLDRYGVKIVDRFVLDGFEFTLVETDVMSLSSSGGVSSQYKQKEAWFQPV